MTYYVISRKWIADWTEIQYDNAENKLLGLINEDLVVKEKRQLNYADESKEAYCNIFTKREI